MPKTTTADRWPQGWPRHNPFKGVCAWCGNGYDQHGYAHADYCPCRDKADLAGRDKIRGVS